MNITEKTARTLSNLAATLALFGAASCFSAAYEMAQGTYDTVVLVMLWLSTLAWFLLAAYVSYRSRRLLR